jgi:L-histidine Nalpha-methyltransferase
VTSLALEPLVEVLLEARERRRALRADALAGLLSEPKELPPKWFYDARGSALFEAITQLPEYYLTRREREILCATAGTVAALSRADTLVEIGSGTSAKTRLLLDALDNAGTLRRFVPIDVSEDTLRASAAAIAAQYPALAVHAVVGDFERHLAVLPNGGGRRLVAFLGSSIGNLVPAERAQFYAALRSTLERGDSLLLGADLVKDASRLEAAYDDAPGVTAAFNRNLLDVLNRGLDADFVPERFDHVVRYVPEREWVEMALRSTKPQRIELRALGVEVAFAKGEELRTEISAKFRRDVVEAELAAAGFDPRHWWEDTRGDFALSLSFAA